MTQLVEFEGHYVLTPLELKRHVRAETIALRTKIARLEDALRKARERNPEPTKPKRRKKGTGNKRVHELRADQLERRRRTWRESKRRAKERAA